MISPCKVQLVGMANDDLCMWWLQCAVIGPLDGSHVGEITWAKSGTT